MYLGINNIKIYNFLLKWIKFQERDINERLLDLDFEWIHLDVFKKDPCLAMLDLFLLFRLAVCKSLDGEWSNVDWCLSGVVVEAICCVDSTLFFELDGEVFDLERGFWKEELHITGVRIELRVLQINLDLVILRICWFYVRKHILFDIITS
jgi:hypothetical protein